MSCLSVSELLSTRIKIPTFLPLTAAFLHPRIHISNDLFPNFFPFVFKFLLSGFQTSISCFVFPPNWILLRMMQPEARRDLNSLLFWASHRNWSCLWFLLFFLRFNKQQLQIIYLHTQENEGKHTPWETSWCVFWNSACPSGGGMEEKKKRRGKNDWMKEWVKGWDWSGRIQTVR